MKNVCIDLDGTLLYYTEFSDMEGRLGLPRPGARDFLIQLGACCRVVSFTARLGEKYYLPETLGRIKDHLADHDLPYDEIFEGRGKPICSSFVDDRAVEVPKNPVESDCEAALIKVRRRLENA